MICFTITIRPAWKISVLYLQNQVSYSYFSLVTVMRNFNFTKSWNPEITLKFWDFGMNFCMWPIQYSGWPFIGPLDINNNIGGTMWCLVQSDPSTCLLHFDVGGGGAEIVCRIFPLICWNPSRGNTILLEGPRQIISDLPEVLW